VSKEKILTTLTDLGLKKTEAKIYFYLAKKGPKKAKEIARDIGVTKQRLYPILKDLQHKTVINCSLDRPAKFSAISYEKILDLFAKTKLEEAKIIQENKNRILDDWKTVSNSFSKEESGKFIVIKGRKFVFSKIKQMVEEATTQLYMLSDFPSLLRLEKNGILDNVKNNPIKSSIDFFLVTEISKKHLRLVKELLQTIDPSIKVKNRNRNSISSIFPRLIIKDNKELLYFISTQNNEFQEVSDYTCISTNCHSLLGPFSKLFEDLWRNSINISDKIHELETGTSPQRTLIIENQNLATELFNNTLKKARKEIIMVISSKEILAYWNNSSILKNLRDKGISFKIMAPISRINLDACLGLSEYVEVRHVANEYVKTIIIDEKHLFQFKLEKLINFEACKNSSNGQVIYSNDFEYVKRTRKMFLDIWKNSTTPSSITAESIIKQQLSKFKVSSGSENQFVDVVYNSGKFYQRPKSNEISEKEVMAKIEQYKNNISSDLKKISLCGTVGYALIRSHSNFKFPNILIAAFDIDEESTLGAENAMIISMEMKSPLGKKHYIPVAVIGDNPNASQEWKRVHEGTSLPARNNYQLFKKDEIYIQTLGNVFILGWTRPILLLSGLKPLPPSALLLEGTGKIKSRYFEITLDNGIKQQQRFNYSDGFVTFMHEGTKYQGPSTDGAFLKEMYLTTH